MRPGAISRQSIQRFQHASSRPSDICILHAPGRTPQAGRLNVAKHRFIKGEITMRRIFGTLLVAVLIWVIDAPAAEVFQPPASPRLRLDFNIGWRFVREDVNGAQAVDFDDSAWSMVSTPHTYSDID